MKMDVLKANKKALFISLSMPLRYCAKKLYPDIKLVWDDSYGLIIKLHSIINWTIFSSVCSLLFTINQRRETCLKPVLAS